MKRVVIAGGTGFLGNVLTSFFVSNGDRVTVLSRSHRLDQAGVEHCKWDGKHVGYWVQRLEGADVVINLNGKSVDCRYNEKNKGEIYDSRIDATWVLGEAMKALKHPPRVWINASSATIYRHATDRDMDETTGELGEGFSVDVCKKWEKTFFSADTVGVRKVALRTAIVLGKEGGALQPLKNLVRLGMGGSQGNGEQYFSWLHELDFARIVQYCIENEEISGVYNASSPQPVTNSRLMGILRKVLYRPVGLPLPAWLLRVGALLIQTEVELVLKSRRVVPEKLLAQGFEFEYVAIDKALRSLLATK